MLMSMSMSMPMSMSCDGNEACLILSRLTSRAPHLSVTDSLMLGLGPARRLSFDALASVIVERGCGGRLGLDLACMVALAAQLECSSVGALRLLGILPEANVAAARLAEPVLSTILDYWPRTLSPKEVLFLNCRS